MSTFMFDTDTEWRLAAAILFEPEQVDTSSIERIKAHVVDRMTEGPDRTFPHLQTEVDQLVQRGGYITPDDRRWPTGLASLGTRAPAVLWLRGNPGALQHEVGVAIVGSRAATEYGLHVAGNLGQALSERGYRVVSGGAYGIDSAAHRGALASHQPVTVCVLPCGVDVSYPAAHRALFESIVDNGGALVSELPPGSTPARSRFLARNRLIAALSAGMVVVEASSRSGSIKAAQWATDIGRPLMAVPGPVTSIASMGTHNLIRSGSATLVTDVTDVVLTLTEHRLSRKA